LRRHASGIRVTELAHLNIESLDHEGRGVAHRDGKAVFVEGALPGERVVARIVKIKKNYEVAELDSIVRQSAMRETPRCPHFGVCGGCSMQHLDLNAQIAAKQRVLEDDLWHIGRVRPETMLAAIHGPAWEYRLKARFSVRNVIKKGGVLVGFHERKSSFVADMDSCEVLPRRISLLLRPLRELIGGLSILDRLPQIELAIGESTDAMVLRILEPLTSRDEQLLAEFADRHRIQFWLQPKGPDSAYPWHPQTPAGLDYTIPEFGIAMPFMPTDFTQVNHQMNRLLVRRAIELLEPHPGERIADYFCGLGNFSLPIARKGAFVFGVEGNMGLVERARANARHNGLADLTEFAVANLFEADAVARFGSFDKALIDPPREGAMELVKALPEPAPRRIVYVSCNPATLARDAGVLCHTRGFRLAAAGVANMFPHTSHVESIALFVK
jgi:23S rRNA (uracil1939-C5)-methyltransferase